MQLIDITHYSTRHRYPRPAVPSSWECCFPFRHLLDYAFRGLWKICSCPVMVDDRCHRAWLQHWTLSLHIRLSIVKEISVHEQQYADSSILLTIGLL